MDDLQRYVPRHLTPRLEDSLREFPAVLLIGARQVGKSTLAKSLISDRWAARYFTLDDVSVLDACRTDPDGFVAGLPSPVILDEIQRAPDLLRAIKLRIDRDALAGQFLLTGSANILTLSSVSETLAGRVAVHELHAISWAEQCGEDPMTRLDDLFEAESSAELLDRWPLHAEAAALELVKASILMGGYPRPLLMKSPGARRTWFDSYRKTYIERDLMELTHLAHLPEFGRLLTLLALRTGEIINVAELSRSTTIAATTLRRDLDILQQTFQLRLLPPYAGNAGRALFRTPKLYFSDTGMACHLAALDRWKDLERQDRVGPLLETWVENQLRRLLSAATERTNLWYFRTRTGQEVDFLLERGGQVVGVEVKWTASLAAKHRLGLGVAREALGRRWRRGIVLYGGSAVLPLDETTLAVPLTVLLGGRRAGHGSAHL